MSTAVVTGATSGIGEALIARLVASNWCVLALGTSRVRLDELAHSSRGPGVVETLQVDLADTGAAIPTLVRALKQFETVDFLVSLAAIWHDDDRALYGKSLEELPAPEVVRVMTVGIIAPMLISTVVTPKMAPGASVVHLSGTFNSGGAGWIHYFTSKRALEQLTVAQADELAARGIRVNCVSPADVATPALIRFFPEDAAEALAPGYVADFIMSVHEAPAFKHVSGEVIELRRR
jgi:NAD(P)-dependent dehydrogenase (short-subunit alcohol dehydrogenase family)